MLARETRTLAPLALLMAFPPPALAALPKCEQGYREVRIPLGEKDPSGKRSIKGYLYSPAPGAKSTGPYKAVVALHGCNGLYKQTRCIDADGQERSRRLLDRRFDVWATELVAEDYVVLFPEDFSDTCKKDRKDSRTPAIVRAIHARRAAEWLGARADIDPRRIALLGWSHGGQAVLSAALKRNTPGKKTKFTALIAFYPGCQQFLADPLKPRKVDHQDLGDWDPEPGVQILVGELDDWTPRERCEKLIAGLDEQDRDQSRIGLLEPGNKLYRGAYHGFDGYGKCVVVTDLPSDRGDSGSAIFMGGPEEARRDAHSNVKAALREAFEDLDRPHDGDYDWSLKHESGADEDFSDAFIQQEILNEELSEGWWGDLPEPESLKRCPKGQR
ncbi:dienelactone hydrolase family protein [Nannocystis pusilla]|uniref:dienelactone hydrolase family protein n=1 Tax=Nannocystis pusilla TaxID=889268 RepID=UPI003DA5EBE3